MKITCKGGGQVSRLALFLTSLKFMLNDINISEKRESIKSKSPYVLHLPTTHLPNRMLIYLVLKCLFTQQQIILTVDSTSLEEEHLRFAIDIINQFNIVNITLDTTECIVIIDPIKQTIKEIDISSTKESNSSSDIQENGIDNANIDTIKLTEIRATRPNAGINNQIRACIDVYQRVFGDTIQYGYLISS